MQRNRERGKKISWCRLKLLDDDKEEEGVKFE